MLNISTADAKNDFANVLKLVQKGEKFVIEYGRKHKKIAMIVPYEEPKEANTGIKIGLYKGKFHAEFKDDFAMTDEELLGLKENKKQTKQPRKFGIYKGKFHAEFSDDWEMTDEELLGLE